MDKFKELINQEVQKFFLVIWLSLGKEKAFKGLQGYSKFQWTSSGQLLDYATHIGDDHNLTNTSAKVAILTCIPNKIDFIMNHEIHLTVMSIKRIFHYYVILAKVRIEKIDPLNWSITKG